MWKEALMLLGIGGLIGGWIGYSRGKLKGMQIIMDETYAALEEAKRKLKIELEANADEIEEAIEKRLDAYDEIDDACAVQESEENDEPTEHRIFPAEDEDGEPAPEPNEPYLVESTAFAPHDCDFETLTYYADDDILVDMYGDPVENLETLIGRAGIDHLESMPADECGSFYVRNPGIDIVYEVEIIRGISYGGD